MTAFISLTMDNASKEQSKMANRDGDDTTMLMEIFTKVIGKMIWNAVGERWHIPMDRLMMVCGSMASDMDKEHTTIVMDPSTRDISIKEKKKDLVA